MVRKTNASRSATSKQKEYRYSLAQLCVLAHAPAKRVSTLANEESLGKKPVKANLHEREEEKTGDRMTKNRERESGRIENHRVNACID
jgi:hypothetical protein